MNRKEFEAIVKAPKGIVYSVGSTELHIYIEGLQADLHAHIPKVNKSDWTQGNADALNKWFAENKPAVKEWIAIKKKADKRKEKEHKAFLKTPEGKLQTAKTAALELAKTAGLHEEHGSSRGDWHTLSVKGVVFQERELKALHASGTILALVSDFRKRVYAKSYKHAPGTREDFYLIGTNENGVSFCHAVSRKCTTVTEAVSWIWGNAAITARHGDIAITPAPIKKITGELVNDISLHDSHHFTGEMHRNGSVYVRNGTLHHMKNQHPDVVVGNEWMRVVIAKRAVAGGSSD